MSIAALQRLDALPQKVRAPLMNLHRGGHLEETAIADILDAGELEGNHQTLLGFAVAYTSMIGKGIPIVDALRMAREQGRGIKMSWSPKRWQAEHNRFSRAETLIRLSAENISYDVTEFDQGLPQSFPGYLIRNSRRLGMEGLRQKHCIASYHNGLLNGAYAIAVVFVDRVRWTVQLMRTSNPEAPLRITQVKTVRNRSANPDVMDRIRTVLDIPAPTASSAVTPSRPEGPRLYMDNLRTVLPVLLEHGVSRVVVTFDGGGDSGSIEDVEFEDAFGDIELVNVSVLKNSRYFDDGRWRLETVVTDLTLEEAIHVLTDDYLEETDVDWYNNDGGFGVLYIHPLEGSVELDVNTRFSESTMAFYAKKDIATGEETED